MMITTAITTAITKAARTSAAFKSSWRTTKPSPSYFLLAILICEKAFGHQRLEDLTDDEYRLVMECSAPFIEVTRTSFQWDPRSERFTLVDARIGQELDHPPPLRLTKLNIEGVLLNMEAQAQGGEGEEEDDDDNEDDLDVPLDQIEYSTLSVLNELRQQPTFPNRFVPGILKHFEMMNEARRRNQQYLDHELAQESGETTAGNSGSDSPGEDRGSPMSLDTLPDDTNPSGLRGGGLGDSFEDIPLSNSSGGSNGQDDGGSDFNPSASRGMPPEPASNGSSDDSSEGTPPNSTSGGNSGQDHGGSDFNPAASRGLAAAQGAPLEPASTVQPHNGFDGIPLGTPSSDGSGRGNSETDFNPAQALAAGRALVRDPVGPPEPFSNSSTDDSSEDGSTSDFDPPASRALAAARGGAPNPASNSSGRQDSNETGFNPPAFRALGAARGAPPESAPKLQPHDYASLSNSYVARVSAKAHLTVYHWDRIPWLPYPGGPPDPADPHERLGSACAGPDCREHPVTETRAGVATLLGVDSAAALATLLVAVPKDLELPQFASRLNYNFTAYGSHTLRDSVGEKRTIEFREAAGTLDPEFIAVWTKICVGIMRFCRDASVSDFLDVLERIIHEEERLRQPVEARYDVCDLLEDICLFAEAAIIRRRERELGPPR
ncbi:hypothetical protein GQX73_g10040 [Xylaria multiplex]|uniref:Uncharacterized protein n=1 Tax=Xylaria multiplex TaxID=323545 RepID=A0A7C8MLE9_9PEZI|nr:hypothetical protein GQX73_g10040 [Xylaria multiplex]